MTDKVWFKIGEAAQQVGATPKELRYWEKVIPDLQPRRSKGNLRYYHQEEVPRLLCIRQWLAEGFTVSDCRELLSGVPAALAKAQVQRGVAEIHLSGPPRLQVVIRALRALHARLGVLPGQAPPAEVQAPDPERPVPAPKRVRKPKPDTSALGRMWSEARLPLDWEE